MPIDPSMDLFTPPVFKEKKQIQPKERKEPKKEPKLKIQLNEKDQLIISALSQSIRTWIQKAEKYGSNSDTFKKVMKWIDLIEELGEPITNSRWIALRNKK